MKSATAWPEHFFLIAAASDYAATDVRRELVGAKAYNLWRMASMGIPVPPALVLGTPYTDNPDSALAPLARAGIPALERATGLGFGDQRNPLLVSVRSGAPVSMPGMMETLLDIGLNDQTVQGLVRQTGNPRLAWDCYRRLVANYAEVVDGLPPAPFAEALQRLTRGGSEQSLDFRALRELTRTFMGIYQQALGRAFPQEVDAQLRGAVKAVFKSWHSAKAREYRRINAISENAGTAVAVQRMVFGNSGVQSGSGVGFTRDPITGEPALWLDFLVNAQGEDVVSGRRNAFGAEQLQRVAPRAWESLRELVPLLERAFGDMQDFEFTVERGELHMLQTRAGKRTRLAAARIALDLLDEGIIDHATALERTRDIHAGHLGITRLNREHGDNAAARLLASAVVAGPGVVAGEIVLDEQSARERTCRGIPVILVRQEAETEDLAALDLAQGLLTRRGARTSHAAVVARQLGKTCLVACEAIDLNPQSRSVRIGELLLHEGDWITLDGNRGQVYGGRLDMTIETDQALTQRLDALRTGCGEDERVGGAGGDRESSRDAPSHD